MPHPAMRQAIQTRYIPATNTRGARVSAWCEARRIVRDWDHALNPAGNHIAVARELIHLMNWRDLDWNGGSPKGSSGYVFTCSEPDESATIPADMTREQVNAIEEAKRK